MRQDNAAPFRLAVAAETVVFDMSKNRAVVVLDGQVILPPGARVELPDSPLSATVIATRLAVYDRTGDPAQIVLVCRVPSAWWSGRTFHDLPPRHAGLRLVVGGDQGAA